MSGFLLVDLSISGRILRPILTTVALLYRVIAARILKFWIASYTLTICNILCAQVAHQHNSFLLLLFQTITAHHILCILGVGEICSDFAFVRLSVL